jgi:adenylylsulfate reductase subunit B
MTDMSIRIAEEQCIGCRRCVEVCPGNLIKVNASGKAQIRHVRDCWGCTSCVKECPKNAIRFYLGADMGGRGSTLVVTEDREKSIWTVTDPKGQIQTIEVRKNDANKY